MKSIFGTDVNNFINLKAIDDTKLLTWVTTTTGIRKEVTKTYYDNQSILPGSYAVQENLRKRVVAVTYEDLYDGIDSTYQHATHYSYDIHGNVKTLWQENKKLYDTAYAFSDSIMDQRYKRIDYDFDLISGKVNQVTYQPNERDQFMHRYMYDADNRITKVETSTDDVIWDVDAKYFYYAHGPLARVEYGNNGVQGIDYAYTLQGWIKGINSTTLDSLRDMGKDAFVDAGNPNQNFAKDAFSYSLNYFKGDYKAIDYLIWDDVTKRFEAKMVGSDMEASTHDLYNGNIKSMVTTIVKPTITPGDTLQFVPLPQATAYRYDQLNRLTEMKAWQNLSSTNNEWNSGLTYAGMYYNKFTYDANGNILTQLRKNESGTAINALTYNRYNQSGKTLQNRLYSVNDTVNSTRFTDDIDDQGTFDNSSIANVEANNNYRYDEIGSMIHNTQKEIAELKYTVYGKVKEVIRTGGSSKKNLKFDYDASGNRIAKHVYDSGNNWEKSEYYIVDAQGNVMSTYEYKTDSTFMSFAQTEKNIYGSSRIGIDKTNTEMISALATPNPFSHTLGNKHFEGVNHLGNVLVTFTDRKLPIDLNNDSIVDGFWPDVVSSADYYPFGVKMKERTFSFENNRYQFNGKQFDDETETSDFGARNLDDDLGIWDAVDPLSSKYPFLSPYNFVSNNPIIAIDPNGKEIVITSTNPEFRAKTFAYLQKLSSTELVLLKNGHVVEAHKVADFPDAYIEAKGVATVTLDKNGKEIPKVVGTKLVSDVINDDHTVKIQEVNAKHPGNETADYSSDKGRQGKVPGGSDATIFFDPNATGKTIVNADDSRERSPQTGLGHELGHTRTAFNGTQDFKATKNAVDPDNCKVGTISNEETNIRNNVDTPIRIEQGDTPRADPKTYPK